MAKRFIDAVNLINELTTATDGTRIPDVDCDNFPVTINLRDLKSLIRKQPTTDVAEVRHGRWIKHKPDSEYIKGLHQLGIAKGMGKNSIYWTCSECEHWGVLHYKYCPNCGSRMDGDEDD